MIQVTNVGDDSNNIVITIEAPLSVSEKELIRKAKSLETEQSKNTSNPIGKGGIRWGSRSKKAKEQADKPSENTSAQFEIPTNPDGTADLSGFVEILSLEDTPDFEQILNDDQLPF